MSNVMRLVVLLSGNGSNLQAIIDACEEQTIQGKIVSVISNRADAYGLERARKAKIPTHVIDHTLFKARESFDQALIKVIESYQADLVVLAGFMRILTEGFVQHYQGRLINIHPSLLPAYKGTKTHERVLADGVKVHGASVHFVTAELDSGAVVAQVKVPVETHDTASTLAERVLRYEHVLYPTVLQWFCAGRLRLGNDGAYLDGELIDTPLQLVVEP